VGGEQGVGQVMAQLREFAQGLTVRQRIMLVAGAVIVALTLLLFVRLIGKPEYKPLYSGMEPADTQALGTRLAAKNIRYEISSDGTSISVPAESLDAARLEIAAEGAPQSGRMGFELFDKPSWTASDFSEKVNFQRALEGELERSIRTLNEVEAVRVHLVLPTESVFAERQREAKAAVVLKVKGPGLSEERQAAIAQLVASAVDKLRPENVSVIDSRTRKAFGGNGQGSAARRGSLDEQLAAELVQTLEPVVGPDRLRASVHVEYDLSSSEENQETYDPNSTVALTMQRSEHRNGASGSEGVPGTSSNLPNVERQGAVVTDRSISSRSENGTYAVNKLTRRTVIPAGRMKRLAVALLVDDAVEVKDENGKRTESRRKRTQEELAQIEALAKAAIGFDAARGDVIAVQNLSFQTEISELPDAPPLAERLGHVVRDWSVAFRYSGIGLLFLIAYLLVLRPVKRQAIQAFRQFGSRAARPFTATNSEQSTPDQEPLLDAPAASPELKRTAAIKRQLAEKVKGNPAAASRLVQAWLREGGVE